MIARYGSVAAEMAVCAKAAGLVDRSGWSLMSIEGPEPLLAHVLEVAVADSVPEPGTAACVAGTWCCRVGPDRAVVAGMPSAVARWRQVTGRAIAGGGLAVTAREVSGGTALSVVGPRAARVLERAGLPADLPLHGVIAAELVHTPAVVVHEEHDHFLLLLEGGELEPVWHALLDAGRDLGISPVGNEALDRLAAAARTHSGEHQI